VQEEVSDLVEDCEPEVIVGPIAEAQLHDWDAPRREMGAAARSAAHGSPDANDRHAVSSAKVDKLGKKDAWVLFAGQSPKVVKRLDQASGIPIGTRKAPRLAHALLQPSGDGRRICSVRRRGSEGYSFKEIPPISPPITVVVFEEAKDDILAASSVVSVDPAQLPHIGNRQTSDKSGLFSSQTVRRRGLRGLPVQRLPSEPEPGTGPKDLS
jgi:hypothetical protein